MDLSKKTEIENIKVIVNMHNDEIEERKYSNLTELQKNLINEYFRTINYGRQIDIIRKLKYRIRASLLRENYPLKNFDINDISIEFPGEKIL